MPGNKQKDPSTPKRTSTNFFRRSLDLFRTSPTSSKSTKFEGPPRLTSQSLTSLHSVHSIAAHLDSGGRRSLDFSSFDPTPEPEDIPATVHELGQFKTKMAFSFANAASANVQLGPEVLEIQTEQLGFLALAGERTLRLLPSPWPADALPTSTSSLFSIAQSKGLIAAAGPDALVLTSTEEARKALVDENAGANFAPRVTVSVPRLSQVSFTSDDSHLVVCAESGGGLAVYQTDALLQNNKEPAFQINTEGSAIRTIAPNPAKENAHVVAVVLTGGQLMLADLGSKQFNPGQNGSVIRNNVSCVAWSVKGKQIVAGLGDGSCVQLDVSGDVKATFPVPPGLDGAHHVSTIQWLANDEFLIFYTPQSSDPDVAPESSVFLVRTNKGRTEWQFSKLPMDPAPPFGMNRQPPSHYVCRLRDWHHLLDTLIVSSVASGDVGLITKTDAPLTSDVDASQITNAYTCTSFMVDSRKANLPFGDNGDTSPIGMALDLTSTMKVPAPMPGDEMEDSPFPLPAMMILNNEGSLCAWWIVYNTALRENKPFAITSAQTAANTSTPVQPSGFGASIGSTTASPFGSAFAKPAATAFGASPFGSMSSGQTNTPAFGTGGGFGAKSSPWGASNTATASPATNAPAFGSSAFGASTGSSQPTAFGQASFGGLGNKASPWGANTSTSAAPASNAPTFGSSTAFGGNTSSTSGFGSLGGIGQKQSAWGSAAPAATTNSSDNQSTASPFSKFSSGTTSAFGNVSTGASPFGQQAKPAQSAFASGSTSFGTGSSFGLTPQPSFGSTVTLDSASGDGKSVFGGFGKSASQTGSVFGQPAQPSNETADDDMMGSDEDEDAKTQKPAETKPAAGLFGMPSSGFKLGSTFKADDTAKDNENEAKPTGKSLFGGDFSSALNLATPAGQEAAKHKTEAVTTSSLFGSFSTGTKPLVEQAKIQQLPEPPQVTSKPIASPATVATASSKPPSEEEDLPPLGGESPVQVSVPDSPGSSPESDEDLSEVEEEEDVQPTPKPAEKQAPPKPKPVSDAPLPPNPYTVKKPSWFSEAPPGAAAAPAKESVKVRQEPQDEEEVHAAPPPLPPNPMTVKKPDWFHQPIPGAAPERQLPSVTPTTAPRSGLFGEIPKNGDTSSLFSKPAVPSFSITPSKSSMPPAPTPPIASPLFKDSTTPAGLPAAPITFQPSNASVRESPRSPSPVRSASTPFFTPGASKPLTSAQTPNFSIKREPQPIQTPAIEQPQPQPTASDFIDDEDDRIRELLDSEIEPSTILAAFIAHQDYAGESDLKGVPGHCERVYRDINSMLDTLGLNARSLQSFVLAQAEPADPPRDLGDLDQPEDWTLVDFQSLDEIEDHLVEDVDENKLTNVPSILADLSSMRKELVKVRKDLTRVKGFLNDDQDPESRAAIRQAKLDPVHALKQKELRSSLSTFQARLAEAEDAVLVLRAKIASASAASTTASATNGSGAAVPTYEAIESTIRKIIRMTQEKSSDVDVLESQMRKLGLSTTGSSSLSSSTMRSSPMRESVRLSQSMRGSMMSTGNAPPRTPDRTGTTTFRDSPSRRALISSARKAEALRTSKAVVPRRGYSASVDSSDDEEEGAYDEARENGGVVVDERMRRYLAESKRRRAVLERVREGLLRRNVVGATK